MGELQAKNNAPRSWQEELRFACRTAADLARADWIPEGQIPSFERLLKRFPMVLPPYYMGLIDRNDPRCPIRLQAIPQLRELEARSELVGDPLQDLAHQPAPRITHRYQGRALIHLTPNCSMNCRYCFRKSLLGESRAEFFAGEVESALHYLAETPSITEVIFSGGDPFLANEATLAGVLRRLSELPQLKRVRFHSRVPVTLPMRIDSAFAQLLRSHHRPSVVVTHFNHPKELTPEARRALTLLATAGHHLLNQSVLLAGVNDSAETLVPLSERLFEAGVLPYYLHHPDRAQGTAHFDLSRERGRAIYTQIRERLPGYLVPRYVVDHPEYPYKTDA